MRFARRLRRRMSRAEPRVDAEPARLLVVHHLFKVDDDGKVAVCECCGRPMERFWFHEEPEN